jgi:hypothetical protein
VSGGRLQEINMERNILWTHWAVPGLEHLRLIKSSKGISGDGMIVGIRDNAPFRVHYKIQCDLSWRAQHAEINLLAADSEDIILHADGKGHWTDVSGDRIQFLDGCLDVDISATPFTNTVAIQRLGLRPGGTAAVPVAYIAVPEMEVKLARQRYTCLEQGAAGGVYRYLDEGLFPGFSVEFRIDADGLVIDYPGLFRRAWAG